MESKLKFLVYQYMIPNWMVMPERVDQSHIYATVWKSIQASVWNATPDPFNKPQSQLELDS